MEIAGLDDGPDCLLVDVVDVAVADLGHRGGVAPAHARRPHDPHVPRPCAAGSDSSRSLGAGELAREAVADPHRDRRRRRLVLVEHVEVRVERRGLVDLGHRQPHLVGERREMRRGDAVPAVLDQVQVLDEEVSVPRTIAQQVAYFVERGRIDLPPPRLAAGPATAGAGMATALRWFDVGGHSDSDGDSRFRRIGRDCPGQSRFHSSRETWRPMIPSTSRIIMRSCGTEYSSFDGRANRWLSPSMN